MPLSKSRPSSPLLPAFGIRDLNEPPSVLGVVQISARQYDSTIQSQPDATLSYVDLDDGEVITVGSSLELGQRLDEPVSHAVYSSRSPVPAWPAFTNAREETQNKMHIFDIRRTSGSLAVWRDHEAYSSKKLRQPGTSSPSTTTGSSSPAVAASSTSEPPSTTNTSTSQPEQKQDDLSTALSKLCIASNDTSSKVPTTQPTQEEAPAQLDKALEDVLTGLQSHLGPLADFLESTANGLRKIAEKTREADTTPVENVLNGFKIIVTEVGAIGLQFLATLDEELEKSRNNKSGGASDSTSQPESQRPPVLPTSEPESKPQPDTEPVVKKVNFVDTTSSIPPINPQLGAYASLSQPSYLQQHLASALPPVSAPVAPVDNPTILDLTVKRPTTCVKPSLMTTFAPPRLHVAKSSIIDSQPSGSDVLTRYPPLPSLRKATSVSGLQAKDETSTRQQTGLGTALSRYPSIGQFEQQTRLKSRNSVDLKPRDANASVFAWGSPPSQPKKTDIYKKPTVEDDADEVLDELSKFTAAKPAVPGLEDRVHSYLANAKELTAKVNDMTARARDTVGTGPASWYSSPLPGAWPDAKMDDWYPTIPNHTAALGPFATTTAAPQPEPSTQGQVQSDLTSRISSPVSETYNRAPIFPRKSQTVSGTNPAARLNGPFDPLAHIPALQPRPRRSQPDLLMSQTAPSSTKTAASVVPAPAGFLRRSQTVHYTDRYKPRDVAPYPYARPSLWNNYMRNNHSTSNLPPARPWSFYPEASRPHQGPPFRTSDIPTTRPPTLSSIRPVKSMGGLRPQADSNSQPLSARPAPPTPAPLSKSTPQAETAKAQSNTVNTASLQFPKPVLSPASTYNPPIWDWATTNISRSSSIQAPRPPPTTQPRGRSGISPPAPFASQTVDECVKQLKFMGFGSDPNELARLNVYAGATAGDVEAAIEMIEEDREAARELDMSSQTSQVGSDRDVAGDFDMNENPWED